MSRPLTRLGLNRERYSREVEPAPSRFTGETGYSEWAARADAWSPEWTPALRERPTMFDGDDHLVGSVDRSQWIALPGRIEPLSIHSDPTKESK